MKRPLMLLIALGLVALASLTRAFFPTEPVGASVLRGVFLVYAALSLLRARRAPREQPRSLGAWCRLALAVLPLLAGLGFVVGHTIVVLFIFAPMALALGLCVALSTLLWAWSGVRRGHRSLEAFRGVLAMVIFLSGLTYLPVCLWLWSRPDPGLCQAAAEHPAVHRLTPSSYPEGRSFPYEMTYLPETQRIAASFKMAGNLSLGIWGDPSANRLAVIDVSNRAAPELAELQLEGEPLPQYMAIGPDRQSLVISRPGYGAHYLDYVDLSGFPDLTLTQRLDTASQPHAVRLVGDDRLVLATMHRELLVLDYASGEVKRGTPIPNTLLTPGLTITDMALSPDGSRAFLAMFGTDLVEVRTDTRDGAVRTAPVGLGAGEVTHDPRAPHLYQTDFFQNTLRRIDSGSLEVVQEWPLDFAPRPVAIAPDRDLLAVGDWLGGAVHFMRRGTGERVGAPLSVGPYLRELAVDDARGLLFTASKCGIYLIELDRLSLSP